MYSKNSFSVVDVWKRSLNLATQNKSEITKIMALGILFPYIVLEILSSRKSLSLVEKMRMIAEDSISSGTFQTLTGYATEFISVYLFWILLISVVLITSFFTILELAIHKIRGEEPKGSVWNIWLYCLRKYLAGGLLLFLLTLISFALGHSILAPLLFVGILACLAPVIYLVERNSAIGSFWKAITLNYSIIKPEMRWSVFFVTLWVGSVIYGLALILMLFSEFILHMDSTLPISRFLWSEPLPVLDVSFSYVFAKLIILAGDCLITVLSALMTATLYFYIKEQSDSPV